MALSRDEAYGACLTQLRATDFDRYLACLLMPAERRGAVAALYAFNAELARVRDLIREPLPGEIRLQWWRDFIDRPEQGENLANPVAAGLHHAIQDHGLPRPALSVMTEARIFDLYDDPMPDRAAFELYAGETASALIQLSGLILDPASAPAIAEAAGHAGIAQLVEIGRASCRERVS
jgi:phytoene synthase